MSVINQGWFVQCDECDGTVFDSIHPGGGPMTASEAIEDAKRKGWVITRRKAGLAVFCPLCKSVHSQQ